MNPEKYIYPEDLPLDKFLTYRVNVLSNLLNKQTERFLKKEHGIAIPDWRVLFLLAKAGPMSVRDLAVLSKTDKALVSRVVSRLIKLDLVHRKSNDYDARQVQVSITAAGVEVYNQILPHAAERQRILLSTLETDEVEALDRILDKLTDFAEEKGNDLF